MGQNSGFKIVSLNVESAAPREIKENKVTVGEKIVEALKYIIYVFIGICFIVSFIGKYHSKKLKSDNVRPFKILFFALYTWDFYSDIMFCVRLGDASQWILFLISMMFIFIPWFMNIFQLLQAQKKWTTDKSVQEGVRGWFIGMIFAYYLLCTLFSIKYIQIVDRLEYHIDGGSACQW